MVKKKEKVKSKGKIKSESRVVGSETVFDMHTILRDLVILSGYSAIASLNTSTVAMAKSMEQIKDPNTKAKLTQTIQSMGIIATSVADIIKKYSVAPKELEHLEKGVKELKYIG